MDQIGKVKGERTLELQFDDINNNKGLANFNIRNIERTVNTKSNLSFDLSLEQVRKITEVNLKQMWKWAKDKNREFQMLDFLNGESIDLGKINNRRRPENGPELNKAIIETINYFIKKGTFLFVSKVREKNEDLPLKNGLLTDNALTHPFAEHIRICSVQEVSRQMYSYLGTKGEYNIGIYDEEKKRTLWALLKEITDRMNLGKKKDLQYTA